MRISPIPSASSFYGAISPRSWEDGTTLILFSNLAFLKIVPASQERRKNFVERI